MNPLDRLNQVAAGFQAAKILCVAAQYRVFDAIANGHDSALSVAEAIGGTLRGTEILLDALVALEFLGKHDGRYTVRPEYAPYLAEDGPTHFVASLRHRNQLIRHWAFLDETIAGRPLPEGIPFRENIEDPAANENFIRSMYAASHGSAAAVVDRIGLVGVRRVADLGGGPGHYLAEFARRSVAVEPYLVDLPLTLETARKIQAGTPEGARMTFVPWDFYAGPAPAALPPQDLVFISQVLHAESPENNRALLARVHAITAPGGRLVIHENVVDPGRTSPAAAAVFAVNMLAMTRAGRTYTADEIRSWGESAGFAFRSGERVSDRSYLVFFDRTS